MKRVLSISFVILGLFCLTGCGKNTLSCSKSNDDSADIKISEERKIVFKKNRVNKLSMRMDVKLSDIYLENRDNLIQSVENEYSNLPTNAVKYSFTNTSDGFKFAIKMNFDKLNEDVKKEIAVIDYEGSYDEIREDLEDSGFTCK